MQDRHELKRVAIRLVPEPPLYSDQPVRCPEDVVRVLGKELEGYDREVACVVNLQTDGTPINMNIISMGTLNMTLMSAREVFKSAILSNAAGIMVLHNHPSGRPEPSRMDLELTEKLWKAAQIMDISFWAGTVSTVPSGKTGSCLRKREKRKKLQKRKGAFWRASGSAMRRWDGRRAGIRGGMSGEGNSRVYEMSRRAGIPGRNLHPMALGP